MTRLRPLLLRLVVSGALALATVASASTPHSEGFHPTLPEVPSPVPEIVAGEVSTPRFRILYTAAAEGSARALAERIEGVRDHFQEVLGRDWPGRTEIRVGIGREEFDALALPGGRPPRWAAAIAYPGRNIILLDGRSLVKPEGEVTLRHELSHVALGQLAGNWPRWFQEGVAMYLTGDRFSVSQYTAMFRAVTQDRLFDFKDLASDWPAHPGDVEIAYAQSVVFVAHLAERHGPVRLGELVDHVRAGADFEVAFARAFKTSLAVEQEDWAKDLPNRYSWWPIVTGGTVFWGVAALLAMAGWVRRKRLQALRLAEMSAQEAAEDALERLTEATRHLDLPEVDGDADDWAHWPPPARDDELEDLSTGDDRRRGPQGLPGLEDDRDDPEDSDDDPDIPPRPRRILH